MSSFRIREFQPDDFEELWRIDQTCFAPGISYSKRELSYYMRQRGAFTLVAVTAGENPASDAAQSYQHSGILGFVVAQQRRGGLGHIVTIDVVPEARRGGVGSQLMAASEERLRQAGCDSIFLETAVDNRTALAFYKRHGYYVIKTIPRYYMNQLDALQLIKSLTE